MKVLVTGGAGYIGSITNRELIGAGFETVILDNFSEGHREAIGEARLVKGDLLDKSFVEKVFAEEHFDAVVHFAAKALAGESMKQPYEYFYNNILGGLNLLEAMKVPTLVIAGGADMYAPSPVMRRFADRIRNSEFVSVPDAGHSVFWEEPQIFNEAVLNFVRKH